ncbi:MAG TPA: CTP synthase [Bacteroidia bacterium]|nr:CTP synthase [Bacteroidia bacterium]
MIPKIAILGDFNPIYSTHHALNDSCREIQKKLNKEIQFDWIPTDTFNYKTAFKNLYAGLWIAPGSPYKDMDNVLNTITYVRVNNIPTLGNCGGFQHMIIEFARNVCSIKNADHEETNPTASDLLISKLSCSLVEQEEDLTITNTNTILFDSVKQTHIKGKYFCSYGINNKYIDTLQSKGLQFTATAANGEVRAFELNTHPFFVGTLFQPALTSTVNEPNPLLVKFVEQSVNVPVPA